MLTLKKQLLTEWENQTFPHPIPENLQNQNISPTSFSDFSTPGFTILYLRFPPCRFITASVSPLEYKSRTWTPCLDYLQKYRVV